MRCFGNAHFNESSLEDIIFLSQFSHRADVVECFRLPSVPICNLKMVFQVDAAVTHNQSLAITTNSAHDTSTNTSLYAFTSYIVDLLVIPYLSILLHCAPLEIAKLQTLKFKIMV